MSNNDDKKMVKPRDVTGLHSGGDEETGNYYCPVDTGNNLIVEKKRYIKPDEAIPKDWVMCN